MNSQSKAQSNLINTYSQINEVIYEAGLAIGARIMEKEGGMSPTEANSIINSSIANIKAESERLGILAKAFNDASRK